MIQGIEQQLLDHLRISAKNSSISIEYSVAETNEVAKPYTSAEVFQAMAKKNPALLKLQESLGLDTDY